MRKGDFKAAVGTATAALKSAWQGGQKALIATSLLRLAEAQFRDDASEEAMRNAAAGGRAVQGAGPTCRPGAGAVGDLRGAKPAGPCGRGQCARRPKRWRCAGACGDLYGVGNALNMLMFDEPDLGTRLTLLNQALAAFEATGYLERQGVVTYNLGVAYANLGLYRRARRLYLQRPRHLRRAPRQRVRRWPSSCWAWRSSRWRWGI